MPTYYFDDDSFSPHSWRAKVLASDQEAIAWGEQLRRKEYNSLVYREDFTTVKEWLKETQE